LNFALRGCCARIAANHAAEKGSAMKLFECQNCGQPLYFENTRCESCGLRLGYLPGWETVTALEEAGGSSWRALAPPKELYRFCANAAHGVCNWLVADDHPEPFCAACRHNRMIPDLSQPQHLARWRKIESAKHRLFYTLLKLKLPLTTRPEDPNGLAFDFLAVPQGPSLAPPVMTGHKGGLITINLAEADDAERERARHDMGEAYRTLLGHFRHEISHYYWDRVVADTPSIEEFRELFGDERQDYTTSLQAYYANGPAPDWPEKFVSAYASSHPWEDFAETWAHYFHMVDTLETAAAFGMRLRPKLAKSAELTAVIDFDPHVAEMDRIVDAWLPLTFAVNSINRSMGLPDLYPFVISPAVIWKLTFIHERVHAIGVPQPRDPARNALRAIVAGLKRTVGSPLTTP
jgi:hypothetical protein